MGRRRRAPKLALQPPPPRLAPPPDPLAPRPDPPAATTTCLRPVRPPCPVGDVHAELALTLLPGWDVLATLQTTERARAQAAQAAQAATGAAAAGRRPTLEQAINSAVSACVLKQLALAVRAVPGAVWQCDWHEYPGGRLQLRGRLPNKPRVGRKLPDGTELARALKQRLGLLLRFESALASLLAQDLGVPEVCARLLEDNPELARATDLTYALSTSTAPRVSRPPLFQRAWDFAAQDGLPPPLPSTPAQSKKPTMN